MTAALRDAAGTGLAGPVSFYAGALLLAASPLMRGGNRHVALIAIELVALVVLFALLARLAQERPAGSSARAVLALAAAPLVLAAVQLLPVVPGALWTRLPGHAEYAGTLQLAGASPDAWRPLSVAPRATAASLLAGLPLAAALLLGYFSSLERLRLLLMLVIGVALLQVAVGVLQLGADGAFLMFGAGTAAPIGTFGNRNHFGSYLAVALCCWLWLGWGHPPDAPPPSRFDLVGLAAVLCGISLTRIVRRDAPGYWRWVPVFAAALLVAVAAFIGIGSLTTRLTGEDLGDALMYRGALVATSWQAALAFLPFGSGWGTYDLVYPRFQPPFIAKFANHAHMDYVEMLVEGGMFFVAFAALFAWLAARRVRVLWRVIGRGHRASREAVAALFCGLGLAVLLLHSFVDFNLRIPALAILACLLAGAFLRPLPSHAVRP